jgi:Uma2 family endonuclease
MSIVAHFTIDQYMRMIDAGVFDDRDGRRIELFRGEVLEMSPIGDRHAWVVERLAALSIKMLDERRVHVRIQGPIVLPELVSRPEPDLAWVAAADYMNRSPGPDEIYLVIEVADTTWMYDSREKAELYAEAGIPDYWLVNVSDNYVIVHRDPTPKGYRSRQQHRGQDELRPLEFPELVIRPDDFLA